MRIDDDVCYRALVARDSRFDGVFFVGVKTTGIYCRPICTAKTPGRERCGFFASAALAERAGFRPCLRCRPELAPGQAPVDAVRTVARAAAARIEAGALSNGGSLEDLAASLGLSSRQLRRAMRKELGVSPVQLAQTNRLLLAKRLIAETQLPLIEVAFAAGFDSVRRFNVSQPLSANTQHAAAFLGQAGRWRLSTLDHRLSATARLACPAAVSIGAGDSRRRVCDRRRVPAHRSYWRASWLARCLTNYRA
jgi:methylphosphotriester-DNA--protein-cysteine methyltransferase